MFRKTLLVLLPLTLFASRGAGADTPKAAPEPVELTGKATDYYHTRNWSSYTKLP